MRRWILIFAMGCGGSAGGDTTGDATLAIDAPPDAPIVTETRITGVLYSSPFTLRYASIKRATPSDAYNWVCVADIPATYDECSMTGGTNRTIFLGPFVYDNGVPKWSLIQVWLYRVGTSYSKPASDGMFHIYVDDPASGAFQMTLDVDFAESSHTTGSVLIPGS